ncbi:unnamed protein product [Discosporangium mesarthrocarpum]
MTRILLMVLLAVLGVPSLADVVEPATKIGFKEKLKLPGSGANNLASTGVRVKKIGPAAVKVYAVGIYVDPNGAKAALSKHKGAGGDTLAKKDGFFTEARKAGFEKALVLKMARKVGTEKMVNALAESVEPRMSGSKDALEKFQSMLLEAVGKEGAAQKGMQFGFVCKPGSLCVSVNGQATGTIKRWVDVSVLCVAGGTGVLSKFFCQLPYSPFFFHPLPACA